MQVRGSYKRDLPKIASVGRIPSPNPQLEGWIARWGGGGERGLVVRECSDEGRGHGRFSALVGGDLQLWRTA